MRSCAAPDAEMFGFVSSPPRATLQTSYGGFVGEAATWAVWRFALSIWRREAAFPHHRITCGCLAVRDMARRTERLGRSSACRANEDPLWGQYTGVIRPATAGRPR